MRKKVTILLSLFLIFGSLMHSSMAQSVIIPPKITSISPNAITSLTGRSWPTEEFTLIGENLITGYRGEEIVCGNEKGPREYPSSFEIRIISWTDTMIKFKFTSSIFNGIYPDGKISCRMGYDTYYDGFQYTGFATDTITLTPVIDDYYSISSKSVLPGDIITVIGSFMRLGQGTAKINNVSAEVTNWERINGSKPQIRISVQVPNTTSGNLVITTNDDYSSNPLYVNIVECSEDTWECGEWSQCSIDGQQTRNCDRAYDCPYVDSSAPPISQFCVPDPVITSIITDSIYPDTQVSIGGHGFGGQHCYNDYSCGKVIVNEDNEFFDKNASIISWSDTKIKFTMPHVTSNGYFQAVTSHYSKFSNKKNYTLSMCNEDVWECGDWEECSSIGTQTKICNKIFDCYLTDTPSPATTQSCTYTPPCTQDTWQCGSWGTCSPQGIKTRSCIKTYDCSSAETASPTTSQYCQAPNRPQPQTPSDDLEITNQSSIIKATVKLLCPVSRTMASQGSGTVISPSGTILTNKHVIDGTVGCLVGFIDDYDDEPYFGGRQIADIYKTSSDADIAILKLRNPYNKTITSINITNGNSNALRLGDTMTTYGYPAMFGRKITYTSGDFSGVDGNYLKTTAIIEHGNSGGGAYLKNGTYIGMPTAVVKGELNSMGYALSVNKINSWLNNSAISYGDDSNNKYSRVSALLEDIDLTTLDSLSLFIADEDTNDTSDSTKSDSQKVTEDERKLITKVDKNLSRRVSGTILLQVEEKGEAWYVYPDSQKKHYLGRPADAFGIMRGLGLGITNNDLNKIPKSDEDFTGNYNMRKRLSGKILLQVQEHGEAWYIYPKDLKRYYMGRPSDAFELMRSLGLGITNNDIRKIDVGEVE